MLTVLSDAQVAAILEDLTALELDEFRSVLAGALHQYSTEVQAAPAGKWQLPHRITTRSPETGSSTLYMPSSGPPGVGVKVVSIQTPTKESESQSAKSRPTGSLTLVDASGVPVGFINATTLTAFRTALSSACLLNKRGHVKTLAVFGSGLQACWHIRLALKMRGSTIRHVHILNRRFSPSAGAMLESIYAVAAVTREREGWADTDFALLTPQYNDYERLQKEHLRSADVIFCCTPSTEDLFNPAILTSHEGRRKGRLIVAVGSYTLDMKELPGDLLRQAVKPHETHRHFHKHAVEGGAIVVDTLDGALKEAGEIVAAGIEPHQLVELGELVMLRKMALEDEENSRNTTPVEGNTPHSSSQVSIADSSEDPAASSSNSSLNGSSKSRNSLPSLGAKFVLPFHRKGSANSTGSGSATEENLKRDDVLARWLRDGNVIYKCVGFGLMDLVVGMQVLKVAERRGLGSSIEDF